MREVAGEDKLLFTLSLEDQMRLQKSRHPDLRGLLFFVLTLVPWVLMHLTQRILNEGGKTVPGIFRDAPGSDTPP